MDPDFSGKVAAQIARLQAGPLPVLEREVAERRIAWFRARHPEPPRLGQAAPRQGFELLFREYMGLSPEDLPIVKENATEIVWESRNPCQTLEACLALGLDIRSSGS
jgi:hypothetical protein